MTAQGYILIEGRQWQVSMRLYSKYISLKRRRSGATGEYLAEVQAFLEQTQYRALVDALREGKMICLPKEGAQWATTQR